MQYPLQHGLGYSEALLRAYDSSLRFGAPVKERNR
jgi:hypothetical protein